MDKFIISGLVGCIIVAGLASLTLIFLILGINKFLLRKPSDYYNIIFSILLWFAGVFISDIVLQSIKHFLSLLL